MTEPARTGTLSEADSKQLLREYGLPFPEERIVPDAESAIAAAEAIGFPVVLKLNGDAIAHKTERDLVRLGLVDAAAVRQAASELLGRATADDGSVDLLVAQQVAGRRELIAGLVRDPQFGPCILFGLGGILAEAVADVGFALAPVTHRDAVRLVEGLSTSRMLTEPFRGEPAVDIDAVAKVLVALSKVAQERPDVLSIDLNPLIVCGDQPIAVDALVEVGEPQDDATATLPLTSDAAIVDRFRPLFHPRGIVVAGVSGHPGKFGFVTLHNLLRFGYGGEIFSIKPDGADVLGRPTFSSAEQIPEGASDMVFVCTPNSVNIGLLRECAKKGIKAAYVTSAGYSESGDEGKALQRELSETAEELGMLLIGPNGQGVISTASKMCAQIVAPYPPAGRISVASQSGNLVSSFLNYSVACGVGVSKAVSLGNSAQTGLADMLDYYAVDDETDVALCYVEGVGDGQEFRRAVERLTARKPLVLVKGGASDLGARAAASHTGALASDDRVFDGLCRQYGVLRAPTVEEAFEWAATFATQPLPKGKRTVVFTSVGGWGVLAADACSALGLDLIPLPESIREAIDEMVPARWSRNNPIDLAGGETRDTIPDVLDIVVGHAEVDAVLYLGIGIQALQANAFKTGPFYPDHGIERITAYHEKQDRRFALAAREVSERHQKPVLCVTELAVAMPENAGPAGVRESGRICYPSAHRAARALRALVDYAQFRG